MNVAIVSWLFLAVVHLPMAVIAAVGMLHKSQETRGNCMQIVVTIWPPWLIVHLFLIALA